MESVVTFLQDVVPQVNVFNFYFVYHVDFFFGAYFDRLIRSSLIFTTDTVVLHFRAAITGKRRKIPAETCRQQCHRHALISDTSGDAKLKLLLCEISHQ